MTFGTFMLYFALGWYALMSVICFGAYALDKRAARRGGRRVPERTLHGVELLGGWPGALLASAWLRHKSSKLGYRVMRGLIVALHVIAWGAIAWLALR